MNVARKRKPGLVASLRAREDKIERSFGFVSAPAEQKDAFEDTLRSAMDRIKKLLGLG